MSHIGRGYNEKYLAGRLMTFVNTKRLKDLELMADRHCSELLVGAPAVLSETPASLLLKKQWGRCVMVSNSWRMADTWWLTIQENATDSKDDTQSLQVSSIVQIVSDVR